MIEPLDVDPILEKLLAKSRLNRVGWREGGGKDRFVCDVGGFACEVYETRDGYGVRISDLDQKDVYRANVSDEIVFDSQAKKETFERIRDIYELARRKALFIPERLASVSELLDKI